MFVVVRQGNRQWVSDITFIPTRSGWLYLAVVLDLFSRKVVGWAMDLRMTSGLVSEALRMAIKQRRPIGSTIMHSDQGVQYSSLECHHLLQSNGLLASMSRKGRCDDNAVVESFFIPSKQNRLGVKTTGRQIRPEVACLSILSCSTTESVGTPH